MNGKIVTMDQKNTIAEAVAIMDGTIAKVGSLAEAEQALSPEAQRIDLAGKTVLPGFIDVHTHLDLTSVMTSDLVVNCHIPPLRSLEDVLERIRIRTEQVPKGELIIGQSRWAQPFPTKGQLDEIAPNHPVLLRNTMHFYLLNEMALRKFGITKDRPTNKELFEIDPGGIIYRHPHTGEPSGQVFDAWNFLFPKSRSPFGYGEMKRALKAGIQRFSSLGITTVTEFVDFPESSRIYQELYKEEELNVRLQIIPCVHGLHKTTDLDSILESGLFTGFGDEWIKFGGIKIFVDRGGDTSLASIQLKEMVANAHKAGVRVFMHANTRMGQDMALQAIEAALDSTGESDILKQDLKHLFKSSSDESPSCRRELRHRIEHMGNRLIDPGYFERVKKTGSIALPTAYFMNIGRYFPEGLKVFLFRTMMDQGLCVAGNSDGGGAELEAADPLYEIWCMVERKSRDGQSVYPEERISVLEALQVYTRNAAFACLEEDVKGSIETGKLADLVVLDQDPLTSPAEHLRDIRVEMTMVGGRIVYRRENPNQEAKT